ncbi:hypothetical protein BKA70DRAFT_1239220 [Coprinopsis sp. MPI-PUGE-AT-0042]|nr:hypothetical protein BKA70DRAFT_1239220 [Coprinopsis sp. MPI-PUGE-AT-0042]
MYPNGVTKLGNTKSLSSLYTQSPIGSTQHTMYSFNKYVNSYPFGEIQDVLERARLGLQFGIPLSLRPNWRLGIETGETFGISKLGNTIWLYHFVIEDCKITIGTIKVQLLDIPNSNGSTIWHLDIPYGYTTGITRPGITIWGEHEHHFVEENHFGQAAKQDFTTSIGRSETRVNLSDWFTEHPNDPALKASTALFRLLQSPDSEVQPAHLGFCLDKMDGPCQGLSALEEILKRGAELDLNNPEALKDEGLNIRYFTNPQGDDSDEEESEDDDLDRAGGL